MKFPSMNSAKLENIFTEDIEKIEITYYINHRYVIDITHLS
jgi:hypothetical protein